MKPIQMKRWRNWWKMRHTDKEDNKDAFRSGPHNDQMAEGDEDLREMTRQLELMNTLVKVVEAKDPYTAGHVWRVSQYAKQMAEKLGWGTKQIAWIEAGAMLHDLGKIGVGDAILQKDGKLSEEEFAEIRKHPEIGVHLIETSTFLSAYMHGIRSHHERFDGKGYPERLHGHHIPIEARIIALADTFDALTSHRPYRKAMSADEAIAIIEQNRGTQFDPALTDIFVGIAKEAGFASIILHSAPAIPLVHCPQHGEIIERTRHAKPGDAAYCPACKKSFRLAEQDGRWMVVM
ncbi:HD domain-containing phosphohydrolase [Marinicrinis sediminis]|uniref:HD domain-containing phosphohydrolase n=1 Tax=Marinicrinis sediminis TaxID=1652465 RepID=A0ABW5RF76_9BACL